MLNSKGQCVNIAINPFFKVESSVLHRPFSANNIQMHLFVQQNDFEIFKHLFWLNINLNCERQIILY